MEDPLAEEIIKGEMVEGDTIEVSLDKEKDATGLKISIVKAAVPLPPAKSGSRKKKEE
jgi:ATP-dependent Clp protease ATP-binding subunit ClpC